MMLLKVIMKRVVRKVTLQKLYRNLTEIDRKIVELIVFDKSVTTTKMAEEIGKSRQTIATRIKELQEKGIVRRNGPDNGGFWEICELKDNNE